jgi:hypothetical protein
MPYIQSMGSFKRWVLREWKDIFGFNRDPRKKSAPGARMDMPIKDINSDEVVEFMLGNSVGGVEPIMEFSNQIRWGDAPGAMMMTISPLGSYKSIVRRLQVDLEGNQVWTCKRMFLYKDMVFADRQFDDNLANFIFEHIEEIHKEDLEAPSHDYTGLRKLVVNTAKLAQRKDVIPELFIFRGIKEIEKDRNYLIFFELRGQGVEAPGRARVEQFAITMSYNPRTGMIRSFGNDIQSPTRGHRWVPQPSEWDEYFSSGQSESEISECITAALSTY